jgi:hypothetical protein
MFIGHFAAAFAAKRFAPQTSLGTLVAAAEFIDVLWPVFLAAGVETVRIEPGNTHFTPLAFESYPISHSLLMVLLWAALFGGVYWVVRRYRAGAIATAVLVAGHWLLDAVVHRPDLPLAPGASLKVGLGVWNSVWGTLLIEGSMFLAGAWMYSAATRPKNRFGRYGWSGFLLFIVMIYAANLAVSAPPSVVAIEAVGFAGTFILVGWSALLDRHRIPVR